MSEKLNTSCCFDIGCKRFSACRKEAVAFFLKGFVKEDTMTKLFEQFSEKKVCAETVSPLGLTEAGIGFGNVHIEQDMDTAVTEILSGNVCLLIDGFTCALIVDFHESLQRGTTEPDKEKVARGAKDGFVEMLLNNVSLIRRRIRNSHLCTELYKVGSVTNTDVCICYMSDRADTKLLKIIRAKMRSLKTEGLPMGIQTLCNLLMGVKRFNPFPNFIYTERPDTTCAQLMHGDVVLMVDNSPIVAIVPVSLFDIMEDANDYYFPPITGIYLRTVRYITAIMTSLLTPLWLLFVMNPELVPPALSFVLIDDPVSVPLVVQLLILEVSIDGLKLASLNTPNMMSTAMSVLSGVIIGDLAVKTGWFDVESLFYMGFVALANFSLPSYELSYALKFSRIVSLILTALFGLWGFVAGFVLLFCGMLFNKTFLGFRFLYPFIPFDGKNIYKKIRKLLGYNDMK